jgi:hypothetical protein
MKQTLTMGPVRSLVRVTVNPNRSTRRDAGWTVVGLEEVPSTLAIGQRVIAVQPDDEGDFVSTAVVEDINVEHRLAYLRVNWDGFADVSLLTRAHTCGSRVSVRKPTSTHGAFVAMTMATRVAA